MRLLAMAILFGVAIQVSAQDRLPPGVRGPEGAMATRSVSKYLQLERDLQDAIRERRVEDIKRQLAADFEIHRGDSIDAKPMEDWLKRELAANIRSAGVRDMHVRELDDLAVVNFFLDRRQTVKGKTLRSSFHVVDIWRQSNGQLLARYITQPLKPPPVPARPSGRE